MVASRCLPSPLEIGDLRQTESLSCRDGNLVYQTKRAVIRTTNDTRLSQPRGRFGFANQELTTVIGRRVLT